MVGGNTHDIVSFVPLSDYYTMHNRQAFQNVIEGWTKLSRPQFHSVGIVPFILGTILAWRIDGIFDFSVFSLGATAVVLIMLSTYHAGEYFDRREDAISKSIFKSRFAGGTGVMLTGTVSPMVPLITTIAAFTAASIIGLFLQFGLNTGPYTLVLGAVGLFCGFFYSTKPVRLVERGIGELVIGFCYGWLPVAAAFYIQAERVPSIIHWISLPIGLSIFNVILINEFLDYPGDSATGKRNLVVRFGRKRCAYLYAVASLCSWIAMVLSIYKGVHHRALYVYLPVVLLSLFVVGAVLKDRYEKYPTLEILCGATIIVNLGTTASYIFAFL